MYKSLISVLESVQITINLYKILVSLRLHEVLLMYKNGDSKEKETPISHRFI